MKKKKTLTLILKNKIETYIYTANSYPILTAEEEKKYAKKLHYFQDLNAAKKLILSHLRFVIHIAKNYSGYGLLQADLIQEGNIGLMKAVRKFNPEIGVRLISFAVHWIKAEIHEYVLKNWRIVKVATTKAQRKLFFNLRKNKKHIGWFNKNEIDLVAKELGVTSGDVREMESRMTAQDMSLDVNNNENKEKENNLFAPILYLKDKSSNFTETIENNNFFEDYSINKLFHALSKLDNRSKDIIKSRWLDEKNRSTLKKLARKYQISAERVRQLEKNAMKKLKLSLEKIST